MKKEMQSKEKTSACVVVFRVFTWDRRGQTPQRSNEVIIWMTLCCFLRHTLLWNKLSRNGRSSEIQGTATNLK